MIFIDTPRDYKRVWNALTGKYFIYPLIGTTLIGGMNYDKNDK